MRSRTKFRWEMVPEALRGRTSFVIGRLALLMRQSGAARLAGLGLTMPGYAVLCCLAGYGASSQKDVAARTGIDASDLVLLLDALAEEMRVFSEPDELDGRRDSIRITGKGRNVMAQAAAQLDEVEDELLAALSTRERLELRELVARVVAQRT